MRFAVTRSDESDDDWDDEYKSNIEKEIDTTKKTKKGKSSDPVDVYLKGKSLKALLAIVNNIAASNSDVELDLSFKARLTSPSVTSLVNTVSKEID